ncbi:MAG: PAS domain-containing protein [Proteobacteria bacterium]|nr:PAS domain-containing protein [Pseudomonadota bacterium]
MQDQLLNKLLKLSNDFILVLDRTGGVIEVGDHLRAALLEQGVDGEELAAMVEEHAGQLSMLDTVSLSLDKKAVLSLPFSVVFRDQGRIILLASDRRPFLDLASQMRHSRDREESFREKDELVHVLLDESSDPIFSFAADGTYLYINRIFADTIGRQQQDVIGKKIWDVFSKEEADKRFAMVKQVFQTGETGTIEVRVPMPGGGEKYFFTTVKPVKNELGSVKFVICISKDITELRKARDEIAVLRGIIPICASCKNIRDDKGYWQRIEDYIASRSEAEFSHGLCPDCAVKLYPEYIDSHLLQKIRRKV